MYSVALQYHQSGLKPMGLMVDAAGRSGLVAILKKSSVSFVRPLDALEHLSLCGMEPNVAVGPEIFHDTPILREDPALCQDVINLMKAMDDEHSKGVQPRPQVERAVHTHLETNLKKGKKR